MRVSFDTEFLTFATPVQGDFEDSYVTSQEISDGVFETTWNFEENGGAVPDGRLLTYVFDVSESAPLVNYPFELEFIAKTADGHEIEPKTGDCNVILI